MTFQEAVLPLAQFTKEKWHHHDLGSKLKHPVSFALGFLVVLTLVLWQTLSQNNAQLTAVLKKQEENLNTLSVLQDKVDQLQHTAPIAQANSDISKTVLGASTVAATPSPTPLTIPTAIGMLQVNSYPMTEKIIYDSPSMIQTIETVKPSTFMLYYKKEAGWYQVDPPSHVGTMGWIQQDNLTEIPNVTELPQ